MNKTSKLFSLLIFILILSAVAYGQIIETEGNNGFRTYESTTSSEYVSLNETDALTVWALPTNQSTSGFSRAPSNFWGYQRTEYLITATEMSASGFPNGAAINSIGFLIATAGVGNLTGTLNIYLMNTTDVTYSLGTSWTTTGFTQVSTNASFSVPITAGYYDIPFTGGSTFNYSGGGVYVAWEFSSASAIGSTGVVHYCNTTLTGGLYGQRSTTALPTTLVASNWRPATRFGTNDYNDIVSVDNIYTLERVPTPFGTPTPIDVRVSNVSAVVTTFNLTVTVRDAETAVVRFTSTQSVTNLAANTSTVVNFTGYSPTILEDVNIVVTTSAIAGENWTVNNTKTIQANVNNNLYSYCYSLTSPGGYGFTYPNTGIFSAKYNMNGQGLITGANVFIYNYATNPGNTVYAVALNSAGTIVAQSANYVIQAGDLGTNKNFVFTTPAYFNNEIFYVGLAQTAGTAQYYPLGLFNETPQRGNTFYTFGIAGGTPDIDDIDARYGIEAQVIAFAGVSNPASFTATPFSTTQIDLTFAPNASNHNVVIVWNNTGVFDLPAGVPPAVGQPFAGGTLLYNGLVSPRNHTGLTASTTYYYRAFSYDGFGNYSPGLTAVASTPCEVTTAPFTEGFEGTTFPPACWSVTGANTWFRTTAASGYGNGLASAIANFYDIPAATTFDLITLQFDISAFTAPLLKFDYAYATYVNEVDQLDIYYSTNNGSTYSLLLSMPGGTSGILNTAGATTASFVPTAAQWASQNLSLPPGTNMIKFTATSAFGNNLFIDNIKVYQVFANDVGLLSVDVGANQNPGTVVPTATVKNYGTSTNSFNVQMTISGGYSSTKTVSNLAADATQLVTFDNWNAALGQYSVDVCTQLGTDQDVTNDCMSKSIGVYTGSFTTGTDFPTTTYLGTGVGYTSTTEATGFLYSFGGNTASALGTECYKYNAATNTWTPIALLPSGRRVVASALVGDFIYVIGGSDMSSVYQSTVYRYDIALDSWTTVAPLPIAVGWGKAVGYNNRIYFAGGVNSASTILPDVYVYDVSANTWTAGTSMPGPKFGGAFSVTGNKLVYVAGANETVISDDVYVGAIDAGNPVAITWITASDYPGLNKESESSNQLNLFAQMLSDTKGKNFSAGILEAVYPPGSMYRFDGATWGTDGVIVTGGSPSSAWSPANPNPTYIYKPATDTWIKQGEVPSPVLGSSIGSVNDGNTWKLIIASGLGTDENATQIWTDNLSAAPTTFQLSVNVTDGWNMVSVPGVHPTNQNVNTWWPNRNLLADVYRWSGSYSPVTLTTPTQGYWMLHTGANTYNTGDEWPAGGIQIVTHDPIAISTGWNMIGAYDQLVPVGSLTTTPSGLIVPNTIYGWNGSYFNPTNLVPGYGYWVLVNGNGVINVPTVLDGGTVAKQEDRSSWGKIIVTDAAQRSYTLYTIPDKSGNSGSGIDLNSYQLPPLPPSGSFDIRFSSQRVAEDLNGSEQTIEMTGVVYPVTVRTENLSIKIKDQTGKILNTTISAGEEILVENNLLNKLIVAADIIPASYSLEQNYPNPFNPSTNIEFSLPEDVENVKLTIYDALGQKVIELVNSKLEAGSYKYKWDSGNAASGLYIYELRTANYSSVKKMLLLR
ncbi:MAG: T9SS type A sorting domain-containing protein [Ignavibacteriales bacterium]|nr:MAG: T9SS type A sorting domain-containing protein [Ignavibacteriales bacterium]